MLGRITSAVDFWRLFKSASVDGVLGRVQQPIALRFAGKPAQSAEQIANELGTPQVGDFAIERLPDGIIGGIVVCIVENQEPLSDQEVGRLQSLMKGGCAVLLVGIGGPPPNTPASRRLTVRAPSRAAHAIIPAVVDLAGDRAIPLARRYRAFRGEVAHREITRTARKNARFSAMSSIPALIPVVGNLFGAAADLLVLTRNQIEMIYVLAAIHGRDLSDRWRLYSEIVPVVGSAFVWRTVARELMALMPVFLGVVPKVVIAYTGTYVVGQTAQFYYTHGRRPSRPTIEGFYRRALYQVSELEKRIGRGKS